MKYLPELSLKLINNKILKDLYNRFVDLPFRSQHIKLLEREVIGSCQTLLDIGCGDGNHVSGLAPYLQRLIGIDISPQSLTLANQRGVYTETILIDARNIDRVFPKNSFHCVVAFDLIEHIEKSQGWNILEAMERIALRKVIVFTPNGFLNQGPMDGNEHQIHRSGWSVSDMHSRGYHVIGVHGIKLLLGEKSLPRWQPNKLWQTISVLTQPLCLAFPKLAFQIFCVKNMQEK